MSVTVTLHIYSGRPDPAWELTDDQSRELVDRINKIENTTLLKPAGFAGALGYRGFSINSVREPLLESHVYIHGGVVDMDRFDINLFTDASDLEEWLLSTADEVITNEVRQQVQHDLSAGIIKPILPPVAPRSVPPYDPGKWNNDPNIRIRNNCYNYANNKITNTFAQPGRGGGSMYTSMECLNVRNAAQYDGQVPIGVPSTTPAQGHFIALVIWPGNDFHWYRQDSNTMWSHKPGQTPARNVDNARRMISDPRNCDRGPYKDFCMFFLCISQNTRIQ